MFILSALLSGIITVSYFIAADPIPVLDSVAVGSDADTDTDSGMITHGGEKGNPDNVCCRPDCESCSAYYYCPKNECKHWFVRRRASILPVSHIADGGGLVHGLLRYTICQ
jgi:hypothetical protein